MDFKQKIRRPCEFVTEANLARILPLLIRLHERGSNSTRTGAGDAIAGRGPFSARTAPALHLRAALSRNARARPRAGANVLCCAPPARQRAMEKRRRLFRYRNVWTNQRLRRS